MEAKPDLEVYRVMTKGGEHVFLCSSSKEEVMKTVNKLGHDVLTEIDGFGFYSKPYRQITHYINEPYKA